MADFATALLEKLSLNRVQIVLAIFVGSTASRWGYLWTQWLHRLPDGWEWIGSTAAVMSGTLFVLWIIAWIWRSARKLWIVGMAIRKGLDSTYFEQDQLVLFNDFAHRGDELNPDVVQLGAGYLSQLEVKHALTQMETLGFVIQNTPGAYSLTTSGRERTLFILKLFRDSKDVIRGKGSAPEV